MEQPVTRRSMGRWYILGLISLMYLITYLDRVNISTAAPVISKEFGFDKITMGVIFSAFAWSYAMFQVPGGWLGDRFGARNVLTLIVTYWSAMTAATAAATGATSFVVFRFLFGLGEAGAFPVATRAMQLWFPRHERGFVQGITHSASRLGAAIAPPIVVLIMTTLGWRSVFYICGAVGIIWSVIWYFAYRNLPEEHAIVNEGELAHIRGTDETGSVNRPNIAKRPSVPWGTLLRSPNMWAIMCAYFTYVYCLWIFLTWLPSYLVEFRHFTLLKVGLLASLPLWAGVVGDTVGGLATDWLLARSGNVKFARRTLRSSACWAVRFSSYRRRSRTMPTRQLLSDGRDVLSGMHDRPVLGCSHGYGRRSLRYRFRHDEHGGKYRRRAVSHRVWRPGPIRIVAGAIHRCGQSACRRCGDLGVLARPEQLGSGEEGRFRSASRGSGRADAVSSPPHCRP